MKEETPAAVAAVRETIREQQKQLQERYSRELRHLKERKDSESTRLKRALVSLEEGEDLPQEPKKRRARARRRARAAATPAAVKERCEAILRFLIEQGKPLSRSAICSSLGLSSYVVRTALHLLSEEGRVLRLGTGAGTRYQAAAGRAAGKALISPAPGTLPGRIVAIVEERGWASLEELVQATGATRPEVRRECETLVREGEINTTQREGLTVFVRSGA
jgi:hypothetical protein